MLLLLVLPVWLCGYLVSDAGGAGRAREVQGRPSRTSDRCAARSQLGAGERRVKDCGGSGVWSWRARSLWPHATDPVPAWPSLAMCPVGKRAGEHAQGSPANADDHIPTHPRPGTGLAGFVGASRPNHNTWLQPSHAGLLLGYRSRLRGNYMRLKATGQPARCADSPDYPDGSALGARGCRANRVCAAPGTVGRSPRLDRPTAAGAVAVCRGRPVSCCVTYTCAAAPVGAGAQVESQHRGREQIGPRYQIRRRANSGWPYRNLRIVLRGGVAASGWHGPAWTRSRLCRTT